MFVEALPGRSLALRLFLGFGEWLLISRWRLFETPYRETLITNATPITMTYFYKKRTARRPWQRRRQLERRLAARPFAGNANYHSKKSLRRDRRKKQR